MKTGLAIYIRVSQTCTESGCNNKEWARACRGLFAMHKQHLHGGGVLICLAIVSVYIYFVYMQGIAALDYVYIE